MQDWISLSRDVASMHMPCQIRPHRPPPRDINLLSKQPPHALEHTIFVWVVWVVFRRYLEKGGEGSGVGLNSMPYSLRNMLIYEEDRNVLSLVCESLECGFDIRVLRLCIHDEEVLLRIWGLRNMADACKQHARYCVLISNDGEELTVLVLGRRS